MVRSSATDEADPPPTDPVALSQALQPVGAGGRGRPIGVAVAIAAMLAALVWQPWGRGGPPVVPATPGPVAVAASPSAPAPSVGASASPADSGPGPVLRPSASGQLGSATYVSLVDNEWTVVAFLAPDATRAADEPWVPDETGAPQAPGGSLLVLQQGLDYSTAPIERAGEPDAACQGTEVPRLRTAVHLPAGRVAYLGVTFPGMDPRAKVTAVAVGRAGIVLKRLRSLVVPLSGRTEARRYRVPSSGPGGAVLFAMSPPRFLPFATYRFDVVTPGISGHRYLYACTGP